MRLEKLGKYISQIRGVSFSPNEVINEQIDGFIPIIKSNNIKEDGFENKEMIFIKSEKVRPEQFIKKGDIVLTASSGSKKTIGKNIQFDSDYNGSFGAFCKLVRPKNEIYPKYLYHFFRTTYFRKSLENAVQGANISNLKNEYIDELKIPLPSLEEQIQIATVLSKAENLIAKRKKSIELLDEFVKSTFLEMFGDPVRNEKGWEKEKLSTYLSDILAGSSYGGEENGFLEDDELGVLKVSAVTKGDFNSKEFKAVKKNIIKKEILHPMKGDLLFSRANTRELVGATCIVNEDHYNLFLPDKLWKLLLNEQCLNKFYFHHLLKKDGFRNTLTKDATGTSGSMLNISMEKLRNLKCPIPPLPLQNEFAEIVNKVEALKEKYQKSLEELENLYGSLSQKAFRGELSLDAESQIKNTSSIPENSKGFAKQVLGGKIVSLFKDDENFTDIKFQKLQYLAEHLAEEELLPNYYRKAAGPYDNRFMHTVFNHLEKNKWFKPKNLKFHPMEKVEDVDKYFQGYFGEKSDKLGKLFKLLKKASEKFCEAVATIYAVWNNHIIQGLEFDKSKIKKEFFEWSKRKTIVFTEEEFEKALEWMQKHQIIPTGFGQLIKEKK